MQTFSRISVEGPVESATTREYVHTIASFSSSGKQPRLRPDRKPLKTKRRWGQLSASKRIIQVKRMASQAMVV